jgi:hypothetical protein
MIVKGVDRSIRIDKGKDGRGARIRTCGLLVPNPDSGDEK